MTQKKDKIATATEVEMATDKQADDTNSKSVAEQDKTTEASKKSAPPSTEEQIAALTADRDALRDKLLRSQAECANISKRLHQQHAEALKLAGMNLARSLLPVLDSFERTFSTLEKSAENDPVVQGVKLIAEDFQKAFRDHGIAPIEAQGKPFDPMQHEAMMQDHETDLPSGTVTQELQRGYTMQDRVLRPAKVAVAAAKPEGKEEKKTEADE